MVKLKQSMSALKWWRIRNYMINRELIMHKEYTVSCKDVVTDYFPANYYGTYWVHAQTDEIIRSVQWVFYHDEDGGGWHKWSEFKKNSGA